MRAATQTPELAQYGSDLAEENLPMLKKDAPAAFLGPSLCVTQQQASVQKSKRTTTTDPSGISQTRSLNFFTQSVEVERLHIARQLLSDCHVALHQETDLFGRLPGSIGVTRGGSGSEVVGGQEPAVSVDGAHRYLPGGQRTRRARPARRRVKVKTGRTGGAF